MGPVLAGGVGLVFSDFAYWHKEEISMLQIYWHFLDKKNILQNIFMFLSMNQGNVSLGRLAIVTYISPYFLWIWIDIESN